MIKKASKIPDIQWHCTGTNKYFLRVLCLSFQSFRFEVHTFFYQYYCYHCYFTSDSGSSFPPVAWGTACMRFWVVWRVTFSTKWGSTGDLNRIWLCCDGWKELAILGVMEPLLPRAIHGEDQGPICLKH